MRICPVRAAAHRVLIAVFWMLVMYEVGFVNEGLGREGGSATILCS